MDQNRHKIILRASNAAKKSKEAKILNYISLSSAGLALILGPLLYIYLREPKILFPALMEGVVFLTIPALNKAGNAKIGLHTYFIAHMIAVGYFCTILGADSNILAFASFLAVTALTIFEEIFSRIIILLSILLMTLAIQFNEQHFYIQPVILIQKDKNIVHWMITCCMFVLILSAGFGFEFERKQRLKAKNLLLDNLRAINLVKSQYVKEVSNDLRGPLSTIFGLVQIYCERISNSETIPVTAQDLKAASMCCRKVQHILNNVLVWSRIEEGEMNEVRNVEFNPMSWLDRLISNYQYQATSTGVEIKVKLTELPSIIFADCSKITRIVENLISNSLRTAPHNSIIQISFYISGDGIFSLLINAPGQVIASDMTEDIFQPYTTFDDLSENTGLTLPIARELARVLGGDLWVEREQKGNLFTLRIPISLEVDHGMHPTSSNKSYNDKVVVLIDDDHMTHSIVTMALQTLGVQLYTFASAEKALTMIKKQTVDLILLDINMPIMDGRRLMRILKSHVSTASIKIVTLSAEAMADAIDDFSVGASSAYLRKPFSFDDLREIVRQLLD